jgi:hypothetical protein
MTLVAEGALGIVINGSIPLYMLGAAVFSFFRHGARHDARDTHADHAAICPPGFSVMLHFLSFGRKSYRWPGSASSM